MKEMKVFKDGDSWIFVLPDFQNLQVSPAEIAHKDSNQNMAMDLIYRNLELDNDALEAKRAIDVLKNKARINGFFAK